MCTPCRIRVFLAPIPRPPASRACGYPGAFAGRCACAASRQGRRRAGPLRSVTRRGRLLWCPGMRADRRLRAGVRAPNQGRAHAGERRFRSGRDAKYRIYGQDQATYMTANSKTIDTSFST
ncbi:hypothetical protein B0H17DRAFT_568580 [Mycena rosella]|uniref:Uncharacterized protein n=1 Tax=Mycena rosella TaxID=1033263 RepID=A0AAD7GWK1_MYCRO|nr:hypothetical protein B0H17DRAFT_568580 [Mycena rosella]